MSPFPPQKNDMWNFAWLQMSEPRVTLKNNKIGWVGTLIYLKLGYSQNQHFSNKDNYLLFWTVFHKFM